MVALNMFKLSLLLSLLTHPWSSHNDNKQLGVFPPSCNKIECPNYDVIHVGNGYEIRRYNSSMWMSTDPIQEISFVEATRIGFLQLFDYIQGKNDYKKVIDMTAPVITEVLPSDGPFCKSLFMVSFYIPKENQANPPPAEALHVQKWKRTYVAVRQFSGFIQDPDVGEQAAALDASLEGTIWEEVIEKSRGANPTSSYTVAQYNSPFEFENRVNEIWFLFDMDDELSTMII